MNVRFLNDLKIFQMKVSTIRSNLVVLHPPIQDVDITSGFELLTPKGAVYGRYHDYKTIYRTLEDGRIILSNDGSVYVEPDPPTLSELKEKKKSIISSICESMIYAGVTVNLPGGPEHFSLKQNDQMNLFGKQEQLAAGGLLLEYHQDGHPCRYYTAEEMQKIIGAAQEHVSYHTTYCNSLFTWIKAAETENELDKIWYGADIPEEYQSQVLKDYLSRIMEEAAEALNNETDL